MYGWSGPRPMCLCRGMNMPTSWQRPADCNTQTIKDVGQSQSGKRWGCTPWTQGPRRQTGMGLERGQYHLQRCRGADSRRGA